MFPRYKRDEELKIFIENTKGQSYTARIILWFQQHLNEVVTSEELAQIPGKDGNPISHNMRRVFELRDEKGFNIINHKDSKDLKVDEWVLLEKNPIRQNIRSRGVNKKIMFEVFTRDNYTCQFCGRTTNDDDPFKKGHKIKLHVGHIKAHKQKNLEVENIEELSSDKLLTKDDFITMCNVCNEGLKNNNLVILTPVEQVLKLPENIQKQIYEKLKEKFL